MSSDRSEYGSPQTRTRILDAAWGLIDQRPTMRIADIAQAAGVSRQAVYLHFGDRTGLLLALVDHIDIRLGSVQLRAHVFDAPTGVESLRRWVQTMSWYTAQIDGASRVLESGQYHDEALAVAWRDRMGRRRDDILKRIIARIADEGALAQGWSVDVAIDLVYVLTMPGIWRELTTQLQWTSEAYAEHVFSLIRHGFIAPGTD